MTREVVAEIIRLAAEVGLVGCTIEDATRNPKVPLYDLSLAVERIAAAAQAAHTLPFPFMLTARTHNFLYPDPSLEETISRLQAFEQAGADVLFVPGLPDLGSVRAVCVAASKPFNFIHDRNRRQILFCGCTRRGRCQAHQPCDRTLSRGNDRKNPGAHLPNRSDFQHPHAGFHFLDRADLRMWTRNAGTCLAYPIAKNSRTVACYG